MYALRDRKKSISPKLEGHIIDNPSGAERGPRSSFSGFDIRMRRLFSNATGRSLIVPLDHAITIGPAGGLENPRTIIAAALVGGANAVMLRPGLVDCLSVSGSERLGVILALTGRLTTGVDHVAINTVDFAVKLAADAVCGEFKFGSSGDLENVCVISRMAEQAHDLGMPVLVTVYTRPEALEQLGERAYAHACRVAEEIGADIIKTTLPDDEAIISECVNSTSVPIVLAGGPPGDSGPINDFLARAISAGISGAAIGRRAWGSDEPVKTIADFATVVHRRPAGGARR